MKDDTDLVQKLLQHDEDVPVPPEHEKQIRAGLAHLLGGPPAPPSPPAGGGGGGGAPPPAASPLGMWLATTAIVAGAAAGGGFLAGRATAPVVVTAPPSPLPAVSAPPVPSPTPCAQETAAPPKPSTSAAPKPSSAGATGTSAQDAFDREQSLLERARSALVRHDATSAEQALDECEKQFPKSRHAEERDYLRIQVTREKGDVEKTRTLAKAFLTKYPQSLLKSRVEQLAQ
jgi:hypothetical protein